MASKNKHHRLATNGHLRKLVLQNVRSARRNWLVSAAQIATLKTLTQEMRLAVNVGDLNLLDGKWYVTHAGLMRLAHRHGCIGIKVRPVTEFCEPTSSHWVFEATVYRLGSSKGFVGYGDADPSNVSPLVRGAEMRIAELAPSTGPSAKPMASASARSKSSAGSPVRLNLLPFPLNRTGLMRRTVRTTVSPVSAIVSAS
jgi:hypothetical protein